MEEEKEKRKNLKEAEKAISAERRFVNLSEWHKRDVHLFCRFVGRCCPTEAYTYYITYTNCRY